MLSSFVDDDHSRSDGELCCWIKSWLTGYQGGEEENDESNSSTTTHTYYKSTTTSISVGHQCRGQQWENQVNSICERLLCSRCCKRPIPETLLKFPPSHIMQGSRTWTCSTNSTQWKEIIIIFLKLYNREPFWIIIGSRVLITQERGRSKSSLTHKLMAKKQDPNTVVQAPCQESVSDFLEKVRCPIVIGKKRKTKIFDQVF